jgi:hypothetical protein
MIKYCIFAIVGKEGFRYRTLYLLVIFLFGCVSTKDKYAANYFAEVFYQEKSLNAKEINEATSFFKDFNKKGDTLVSKDILNNLDVLSNIVDTVNVNEKHYFFKDTVRIDTPFSSSIFIPELFKKHVSSLKLDGRREYNVFSKFRKDYDNENDSTTQYSIFINRKKIKRILNLSCYYVEIIEIRKLYNHSIKTKWVLYVSDELKIPINNYAFLDLRKTLNFYGLIMEAKKFNTSDKITKYYEVSSYDTQIPNIELIDIKKLKSMK